MELSDFNDENIYFFLNEINNSDSNKNLTILDEFNNSELSNIEFNNYTNININNDSIIAMMKFYDLNFTIKQLLTICEYYGIVKELKVNKSKKPDIINAIIIFENNPENSNIFFKRQQLWYFMEELKSDKFMKKFIMWN
jgi:hypothetical protein